MNTRASRAGRLLVLALGACCLHAASAIKLTVTPFGTECVVESAGEGEHVCVPAPASCAAARARRRLMA